MGCTDFLHVYDRQRTKNSRPEICPDFDTRKSHDLMIKGGTFYAIWNEDTGLWSTDLDDVINMIDKELDKYKADHPDLEKADVLYMKSAKSGSMKLWWQFVKQLTLDNFHPLDTSLTFLNTPVKKEAYASKRLPYALEPGNYDSWDELIGTLYSPEERHKIEWAIGSVVNGASKELQKFFVFYGDSGTGKSTVLNIIEDLFTCRKDANGDTIGYCGKFKAKALGSANQNFALESFKDNPLVAIQHDGDLSRIEDNTVLNSVVSHESQPINAKYEKEYNMRIRSLLFIGTNRPVKITDSKSGIIRRLIDITPSGNIIPRKRYKQLLKNIEFEHGAIAYHCKEVFEADPGYYDNYIPKSMISATNDFYNFMEDCSDDILDNNVTCLNFAWMRYKLYCDDAKVPYPYSKKAFKEELKNYFSVYKERGYFRNESVRNVYENLKVEKFSEGSVGSTDLPDDVPDWLKFNTTESQFDRIGANWPAQYAFIRDDGSDKPTLPWDKCETILADLNTSELHYVRPPEEVRQMLVTVDFDKKDPETGKKSLELNMKAASQWVPTYAELSKSGVAIHLEYFYTGDVSQLASVYEKDVEIKVFTGKASLRRKLTRCNDLPITTISSGLPLRKEKVKTINEHSIEDPKHLKAAVMKALRKEISPYSTVCCVDYIGKVLNEAYDSGMKYDLSDLKSQVLAFAAASHNHALQCMDKAENFPYKSEDEPAWVPPTEKTIAFFDTEVFPNLFILVYKPLGLDCVTMINPTGAEVLRVFQTYNMIGFNNLGYDNTICLMRIQGATNFELFVRSQNIITNGKGRNDYIDQNAKNLSYTDVFDFCSTKQGLKKWEIALQKKGKDIRHDEAGLPWDQPVAPELWKRVAEYCCNDVIATEQVFLENQSDFKAREILVDIANAIRGPGSTVNDTTNNLTARIIVGDERNPQGVFVKPDLTKLFPGYEFNPYGFPKEKYMLKLMPSDLGYVKNPKKREFYELMPDGKYKVTKDETVVPGKDYYRCTMISGKSFYKGYDPGEGGFVYADCGMYGYSECYDSASHHPSSLIAENGFGPYTENFKMLLDIRLHIKHKDYDWVRGLYGGILAPYLTSDEDAKQLSYALKIAINSVYGLTAAHFPNKLRDPRNDDNWVAKRGALFMIDLLTKVKEMGYHVLHVKTDSIKIENPDEKIFQFVYDYGKKFGYTFEVEHKFEKICLVNNAVYICKYSDDPANGKMAGKWEGTGDQFKEASSPYEFKTLFSHDELDFYDLCVTQTVKVGLGLYLDMDEQLPDSTLLEKEEDKLVKKWHKVQFELTDENEQKLLSGFNPILVDIPDKKLSQYASEAFHADYIRLCEVRQEIEKCHDYHFVGKAGLFCPIKPGCGGGRLVRENNGKYAYAAGSKDYRWLEANTVRERHLEDLIDMRYFEDLKAEAVRTIEEYGSFEAFVS